MKATRGKTTAHVSMTIGAVVIALAVVFFRHALYEEWHLWRLGSWEPVTRCSAFRWLGKQGTSRLISRLLRDAVERERRERVLPGETAPGPVLDGAAMDCPPLDSSALGEILRRIAVRDPKGAARALSTLLKDPDRDLRHCASWEISRLGPEARVAMPEMVRALRDPEGKFDFSVAYALGRIGPPARAAFPAILAEVKGDTTLYLLGRTLGRIATEEDVPALLEWLRAGKVYLQMSALMAFEEMGPRAKGALPALKALLDEGDDTMRRMARRALREIERR